jgi:uncharacterized membrane protein YwzB
MDLVHLLVVVAVAVIVICVIYWLLNQVTLDPMIRKVVTIAMVVIVAIIAIIFLLQLGGMSSVHVG